MWQNTTVRIPLGESIEDYKNVPKATLYKDGILLSDTSITYNTEGDWLYYFKDIDPYSIGEYYVWYKAYDSKYSPGTCTGYKALINFIIEDKEPPSIKIIENTYKVRRGMEYDLSNNYYAHDNDELKDVRVISNLDINKIGIYEAKVVAIDNSNNQTVKSFNVEVYEDSYPAITCLIKSDYITIPYKESYDIGSVFTAYDVVDGDITNKINYPELKNDTLGEYTYTVSVTNNANLTTEYSCKIKVVDDEIPVLELNSNSLVLDYTINIDEIDFLKYIKTLSDNQEINYDNLKVRHNLENKVGSYTIWYSYTDLKHTVEASMKVTMTSYDKPTIYADDIIIYTDSSINIKDFISVKDASDPNVINTLEIFDSDVNYSKEGVYYIDVYCINSSGQSANERVKVTIKERSLFKGSNMPLALGMIVSIVVSLSLGVFILVYFLLKRKKNE